MAPTTGSNTTAAKSGPGRKKKSETPAEPTRRSTRTVIPRTIFSSGVTKPKAAPKKRKTTTVVKEKVVAAAKQAKAAVTKTKKKPGPKPAGTKKTKASDAKGTKKTKTKA